MADPILETIAERHFRLYGQRLEYPRKPTKSIDAWDDEDDASDILWAAMRRRDELLGDAPDAIDALLAHERAGLKTRQEVQDWLDEVGYPEEERDDWTEHDDEWVDWKEMRR